MSTKQRTPTTPSFIRGGEDNYLQQAAAAHYMTARRRQADINEVKKRLAEVQAELKVLLTQRDGELAVVESLRFSEEETLKVARYYFGTGADEHGIQHLDGADIPDKPRPGIPRPA